MLGRFFFLFLSGIPLVHAIWAGLSCDGSSNLLQPSAHEKKTSVVRPVGFSCRPLAFSFVKSGMLLSSSECCFSSSECCCHLRNVLVIFGIFLSPPEFSCLLQKFLATSGIFFVTFENFSSPPEFSLSPLECSCGLWTFRLPDGTFCFVCFNR